MNIDITVKGLRMSHQDPHVQIGAYRIREDRIISAAYWPDGMPARMQIESKPRTSVVYAGKTVRLVIEGWAEPLDLHAGDQGFDAAMNYYLACAVWRRPPGDIIAPVIERLRELANDLPEASDEPDEPESWRDRPPLA